MEIAFGFRLSASGDLASFTGRLDFDDLSVPEPSTFALAGFALLGLGWLSRRP